jgi:hypothetical protein
MSKLVCRYCVAERGLKASELAEWPEEGAVGSAEWLVRHIESEHHIPVQRDGETADTCLERFAREQPDAGTDRCKCPDCRIRQLTAASARR